MKLSTYLIFFLFFNLSTQAITINELTESVVFGMETSGTEACILAEIKLMEKARREVEGEFITSESLKLCKSSENEVQCQYFTNTFSSIASIQIVKYEPLKFPNGKECEYSTLEDDNLQVTRKGNFELKKTPKQNGSTYDSEAARGEGLHATTEDVQTGLQGQPDQETDEVPGGARR